MAVWAIDRIAVSGGFLSDLNLELPMGLICVIGPRGSGKSTLAEAIRLALGGLPVDASKSRLESVKANLNGAVLTLSTKQGNERGGFTVRRAYGQTAILAAADGRPVTTVDLDRGTFLPIDAYSGKDIEDIADESFGSKRRNLLDDLCANEMLEVHQQLSDQRRLLEANAEGIKAHERKLRELSEQIEELGDVKAKLEALPPTTKKEGTPEFQAISSQKLFNGKETRVLSAAILTLRGLSDELSRLITRAKGQIVIPVSDAKSENAPITKAADQGVAALWTALDQFMSSTARAITAATEGITAVTQKLQSAHAVQEAKYLSLQHQNQEAVKAFEARTSAERDAATVVALQQQKALALADLTRIKEERKGLKAAYILTRDRISELREAVAARLQSQAGAKVRVRVQRNADVLEYQEKLLSALYGSKLKNQDDLLRVLCALRPEDLAVMIRDDDFTEFDTHTSFGRERGRKVLDALRQNIDPLQLEILQIDDRVIIELDVSTGSTKKFKDASELSQGQKCTALLPILLARRDTPLVIDQPEDNLDNHFIYETVVESILRLKPGRQMIFITHNANIPVLGEAEMVVVMNSDGQRGFVQKAGTVDQCRDEIIDLLEGGEEAFQLRRKRYGN